MTDKYTHKEIFNSIEKVSDKLINLTIKTVKIEEHLKTLNGSVLRHEASINDHTKQMQNISEKINDNKVQIIKNLGIGSFGGGVTAIIFMILKYSGKI